MPIPSAGAVARSPRASWRTPTASPTWTAACPPDRSTIDPGAPGPDALPRHHVPDAELERQRVGHQRREGEHAERNHDAQRSGHVSSESRALQEQETRRPEGLRAHAAAGARGAVDIRAGEGGAMRLLKRLAAVFFLLVFAALAGTALWALWPERAEFDAAPLLAAAGHYDVRILRDRFGVPHVYGQSDADVAYGLGFAHCEDDFDTIQRVLLASRGRLASVEGRKAAPADFLFHWFGVAEAVAERYERDLSPEARALAEAYADGVNHYAALHREAALPGAIPATGRDVVAGFTFRTPFFYGLERALRPLFDEEHPP